ncbi:MAG: hypothetical protein RL885_12505 [Planctomycetota bacterium]
MIRALTILLTFFLSESVQEPAPRNDEILIERLLTRISTGQVDSRGHQYAVATLRRLDPSIVPQVNARLKALAHRADANLDNLCEVLEVYPDESSVGPLVDCLDRPELRIQTRVVPLLGAIGDPSAVGELLRYGERAPEYQKQLVTDAVIRIGGPAAEEFVRALLDAPSFDASQHALAAYRLWKQPEILPVLRERLEKLRASGANPLDRIATAWTVGVLGDETGRDDLITLLDRELPGRLQDFVIACLGEVGDEASSRALAKRLPEADQDTTIQLAHALSFCGDRIARRELRTLAQSPTRRIREEALDGLARMGEREAAWTFWLEIREDPWSAESQRWIDFYTARLHEERIAPDLLQWFEDAGVERQFSLVRALGHLGDGRAIPPLLGILLEEDVLAEDGSSLSDLAVQALANCGVQSLSALRGALDEADDADSLRRILVALRNAADRYGEDPTTRKEARLAFDAVVERFDTWDPELQVLVIQQILPGFFDLRFGRWLVERLRLGDLPEDVLEAMRSARRRYF